MQNLYFLIIHNLSSKLSQGLAFIKLILGRVHLDHKSKIQPINAPDGALYLKEAARHF
jgi:hypothetical protein